MTCPVENLPKPAAVENYEYLQDYIRGNFEDYEEFQDFLRDIVSGSTLDPEFKTLLGSYVDYFVIDHMDDSKEDAFNDILLDSYYTGSGILLEHLRVGGPPPVGSGPLVDLVTTGQGAAKAMGILGLLAGAAAGMKNFVDSGYDPAVASTELISKGAGLATGIGVQTAFVLLAGGAAVASAPALLLAGAAGIMAGAIATVAFEEMWGDVLSDAADKHANAVPDAQIIAEALQQIAEDAQDIFDNPPPPEAFGPANPFEACPTNVNPPLPETVGDAQALWNSAPNYGSPLVLDLDGDGIELTTFNAASTATFFDIDGDNFVEQTAWITANQDGLLVRDLNENGAIDGVEELFGSPTIDGFALLATLDDNGDHLIDQYDEAWSDLLIWKDVDGDAVTDSGELLTLASLNIVSFDLAGVASSTSNISGNPISHTSTYKLSNGSTRSIVDAWFAHDNVNTHYTSDYTLDMRTLFLPSLRGYGTLPDLHAAMSMDEDLLEMVQDIAAAFTFDRFDSANEWTSDVSDILFEWAGVESVNPTSRGPHMDAQRLGFLEAFFGEDFRTWSQQPNPNPNSAALLEEAWTIIFKSISASLMVQMGATELFADRVTYNVFTGEIEGDPALLQTGIEALETFATDTGVDTEAYWYEVGSFLKTVKGFDEFTSTENGWMNDSIVATDAGLSWTGIKALVDYVDSGSTINGTGSDETINGSIFADEINASGGHDTVYGGNGDDDIDGGTGNDTLYGDAGNDYLTGGGGDDILYGGAGGDQVLGGYGNDVYMYESGDDLYQDNQDTNTVKLPTGIALQDLSFYRIEDDSGYVHSLTVVVGTLGTIELVDLFNSGGNLNPWFGSVTFADTSTYAFSSLTSIATHGGEGADDIRGGSGSRADTFYGYGGDDEIRAGSGNDTLDGGVGNDFLEGNAGNDTYYASPGFDTISEGGGTDVIIMPVGIDLSDVELVRLNATPNELYINVDGLGQIFVDNQFQSSTYRVETIQFSASSLDLTTTTIQTIGTAGNDIMTGISSGASADDIFDGREGNDTMQGGAGNDVYYFSTGQDTVDESTGSSNDGIKFREGITSGDITLYRGGYQGKDLIFADQNGNTLEVNNHFDNTQWLVEYAQFFSGTTWTFSSMEIETRGTSGNDTIFSYNIGDASSVDTIYGYAGNDQIHGADGNDLIYGGDGTDSLYGENGDDILYGEDGADTLSGGANNDTIYGGIGNDTINGDAGDDFIEGGAGDDTVNGGGSSGGIDTMTYANASGAVTVSLATTSAQNTGGDGTDTISYVENLIGSAYGDTLTGSTGDNTIKGGAGDDAISGGNGNDVLYGGAGTDSLTGGANADTFVFELLSAFVNQDTVADFSTVQNDKIDIGNVIEEFNPLTDAIANWVNFTNSSANSIMSIDRDGTGATYGFVDVATLNGVNNLDETTLYSNGNLLAA